MLNAISKRSSRTTPNLNVVWIDIVSSKPQPDKKHDVLLGIISTENGIAMSPARSMKGKSAAQ
jgi:hypothetical protein